MKTKSWIALIVAVLSIVACDDGPVRAPVTIVVDTDGARAREDATQLRELQKGVQGDRAQLNQARIDIEAVRKSLSTATTAEQRASLAQQMAELQARADSGGVGNQNVVTRDELDAQLRAQEERLKTFISAEVRGAPQPPSSPTTTTPATAATSDAPTVAQARALVTGGKALLRSVAAEVADVDGATALVAAVDGAAAKGDAGAAVAAARAFADKAAVVVVDKGFCRRKWERVNTLVKQKQPTGDVEKKAASLLAQAQAKTAAGDFAGANAALNDALDVVR